MSRGRNWHSSVPEPDDERPSALSADGLTVGPLLGEDGEDMGTYHFAGPLSDAPPGLVLPLVAGFARAVSPGGRWRSRASAIRAEIALHSFVRGIVKLYPDLDAIEDLPHMLRHSFALRWRAVGVERLLRSQNDPNARPIDFLDPWVRVQHLLGHRSLETTRNIYLEPLREVDLDRMVDGDDGIGTRDEILAFIARRSPRVQGSRPDVTR